MSKTKDQNKEYVKQRLQPILDILPSIAEGDFSKRLDIPKKKDEFTEIYVGINCMLEDLNEYLRERKRAEKELQKTMSDLERFNRLAIGRELRMIELKQEVNDLLQAMGREEKYKIPTSENVKNKKGG